MCGGFVGEILGQATGGFLGKAVVDSVQQLLSPPEQAPAAQPVADAAAAAKATADAQVATAQADADKQVTDAKAQANNTLLADKQTQATQESTVKQKAATLLGSPINEDEEQNAVTAAKKKTLLGL